MKTISILGGGWLGLSLAKFLQNDYKIKISSRTDEKLAFYKSFNFKPYILNEENYSNLDELLECNYLFVNFPPSKFINYLDFLSKIYTHKSISNIEKIIFISSTSIYPSDDGIYFEDCTLTNPTSQIVFDAEQLTNKNNNITFRCAGLIGDDRIAGKYFANKTIYDGNSPVNHIHKLDVLRATKFVIEFNINGIFNLCAKSHPTKKDLYLANSAKFGFDKPIFIKDSKNKTRIIDGSKIEEFGFKYQFNSPLTF